MQFDSYVGRMFGLVLDLSYRQTSDGQRIIDVVKKELAQFVADTLEGEDLLYLYHPEIFDSTEGVGSAVSVISNYETDGWLINLDYALRQTFFVIDAEDEDSERMLLFITDRLQDDVFRKLLLVIRNHSNNRYAETELNCNFLLVGIGSHYRKRVLQDVADENEKFSYIHIDDPSELRSVLRS